MEFAALIASFFQAVTFETGDRPAYDTIHDLFIPSGMLIRCSQDPPEALTVGQFIASRWKAVDSGELTSFTAIEMAAVNEVFGNMGQRFSAYTNSGTSNGTPFEQRGMISTQFVQSEGAWQISSMAWDDERPGLPYPDDMSTDSRRESTAQLRTRIRVASRRATTPGPG